MNIAQGNENEHIRTDEINRNEVMAGKTVIVTGATSGIGKEIAVQLAAMGAEIVLPCRDLARGEQAAAEITRRTGALRIAVMLMDASSQQSIREFAHQYRDRYPRLDVLVNNAGAYFRKRQNSVDGIELTFATNVLGYHLLTRELLDLLQASAPARIVNTASAFARFLDLDDLQFERRAYVGLSSYAQSKACNRMFTWALARRLEGSNVTANAMMPGFVRTGFYRDASPALKPIIRMVGGFVGRSVAEGADTSTWLASSPDMAGISNKLFEQRKEKPCEFRNLTAEEKLWSICDGLVL